MRIVLWSLAAATYSEYIALVICFCIFLALDSYGFLHWLRMQKRKRKEKIE